MGHRVRDTRPRPPMSSGRIQSVRFVAPTTFIPAKWTDVTAHRLSPHAPPPETVLPRPRVVLGFHLGDHDQALATTILDGNRRDTAAADLLSGRLDVVGVVVPPVDDQQVLDAADDEQ